MEMETKQNQFSKMKLLTLLLLIQLLLLLMLLLLLLLIVLGSIGVDPSSVRGYPTAVTPIVWVGHLVSETLR